MRNTMRLFDELENPDFGLDGCTPNPERIRVLNELVINQAGTQFEVIKKERLKSKKNIVYHIILKPKGNSEVNLIVKVFVNGNFEIESYLLKRCADGNLKVPKIIEARDGVLLLSFIEGESLVDRINRTFDTKLIDDLAQWYFGFHSLQTLLKGDPRLRNFIVGPDGLYGVDFEEAYEGHWMADIGGIATSLLDTDPVNDNRKRIMVWHLLNKYLELKGISRTKEIEQDFINVIYTTLKQTAERRKSRKISNLAHLIRKEGLPV